MHITGFIRMQNIGMSKRKTQTATPSRARLKRLYLAALCLTILPLAALLPDSAHCRASERYISQEYIDTVIQQAFYRFHSAAEDVSADNQRQKEAISHARNVCSRLRRISQGDPNRKYILWKVSELEQHILLEERDLLLKKMKEGQADKNILVRRFNAEVGKPRPDFASLVGIHKQMLQVDVRKANEMAESVNQRNRNVSREVMYTIEKALITGDFEKAREELAYCDANRGLLNVSASRCAQFEQQIQSRISAQSHQARLDQLVTELETKVNHNQLAAVWTMIRRIQSDLSTLESEISAGRRSQYSRSLTRLIEAIDHKEDSLVALNLSILKRQGIDPAIEFMERSLRVHGLSRTRIAVVDSAILAKATPEDRARMQRIQQELAALSSEPDISNGSLSLASAKAIARKRAQTIRDSLRAIEEEKARKALIEQARLAEIERKKEEKMRAKREKTLRKTIRIYTLLEKGRVKRARRRFGRIRDELARNAPDAYTLLEKTVQEAYENRNKPVARTASPEGKTVALVEEPRSRRQSPSPTKPRQQAPQTHPEPAAAASQQETEQLIVKIYSLLEEGRIREAYSLFTMKESFLKKNVGTEPFLMLDQTVSQAHEYAYAATSGSPAATEYVQQPEPTQHSPETPHDAYRNSDASAVNRQADDHGEDNDDYNTRRAQEVMANIYRLLENNQVRQAYDHFQRFKEPLEKYAAPDAFRMLETTILQAYQYLSAADR